MGDTNDAAGLVVLRVESELTDDTLSSFRVQAQAILDREGDVLLDLRATVVDSDGLGAILSLQRRLELQQRRLMVVSRDPRFLRLLDTSGASHTMALFQDVDTALSSSRSLVRVPPFHRLVGALAAG